MTRGVDVLDRVVGHTCADEEEGSRGRQITAWLAGRADVGRYAVVDDLDPGITEAGHPFVRTVGSVGLTGQGADRLIGLLT